MNKEAVLENLCIYDTRSPYYDSENEYEKKDTCFCDNCFYGRHTLTEEILKLSEKLYEKNIHRPVQSSTQS